MIQEEKHAVAVIAKIDKVLDVGVDREASKNGHPKHFIEEERGQIPMKLALSLLFSDVHPNQRHLPKSMTSFTAPLRPPPSRTVFISKSEVSTIICIQFSPYTSH